MKIKEIQVGAYVDLLKFIHSRLVIFRHFRYYTN